MRPELLAYLAGCMDSDGYFTIRRDTRAMRQASRTPTHVAQVGLRQVTPEVPNLLHETFGGHLGITKPTAANGRPLWSWHATAVQAARVCAHPMPYLRIKPAQAQVLIDLQARKSGAWIGASRRVPDSEIAARDELTLLVQSLNKTGRRPGDA
jgi:hypothetical protein